MLAYSLNMHKLAVALPCPRGNHLQQHVALGVVFLMILCVELCKPSGDVNGERSTALPPLQTSAPESSLVKTNIPLSTPRLSEEANRINSRKSQTTDHAPSPSKGKSSHRGIIRIFGSRSKSMSTTDQEGSEFPSQEPRKSTKYDPKTVASSVEAGLKSSLHTNSDGRKSKQPSESSSVLWLHSRNEKSFWPNKKKSRTLQTDKTLVAGESTSTTITNLKPDGRIKTTRMTLFPSPSVKSKGFMPSAIVSVGGNKPPISSPFTGSVAVTQRSVIHPEASPSYIGTHEIRTVGIGSQTVLIQPGVSKTQSQRILNVSPTPTPFPTVPRPHVCNKGQSQPCICMNCEGNLNKGLPCCIDVIDTVKLNEGVVLSISSMALKDFISAQVPRLTNVVSKLVADHCSQTSCIQGVHTIRKRNIIRDDKKQTNGAEEPKQFITSWDGSPISPSDTVRPPRNSPTKSLLTATPATVTPSITRSKNVKVVMFKIAPNSANQKLSAAFYVTVTSLVGDKNMTYVLKADVLAGLIRRKRDVFKRELNMKIDSVTTWPKWRTTERSKPEADSATSSGLTPSVGAALTPAPGAPNVEGQEGRNSTTNMSRGTFIIVLVTGIGGFVVLAVIIIYMLVKFLRRMKGEFVPDKVYPNEQKANGGSDQLIPSFVDPSTPRITDVPKKTVRAGGGGGSGSGGGQGSGGSKKTKKPMGVKVTYKPPKWD